MSQFVAPERRRMAQMLGLHPERPDTWPLDTIDWLINIQRTRPQRDLDLEIRRVVGEHKFIQEYPK